MIKSIIGLVVAVAIAATVAYKMDLLSYKGEDAYEKVEDVVKDAIDK